MVDFSRGAFINALTKQAQGVGGSYVDKKLSAEERRKQLMDQIRLWQIQQGKPVVTEQSYTAPPIEQDTIGLGQGGPLDLRARITPEVGAQVEPISLMRSERTRPGTLEETVRYGAGDNVPGFDIVQPEKEMTPSQQATEEHRRWQRQFAEKKESMSIDPAIKTALTTANAYISQARSLPEGDPNRTLLQTQGRAYLEEVDKLAKQRYGTNVPQYVLTEIQIIDPNWFQETIQRKTGKESVVVRAGSDREKAIKELKKAGLLQTEENIAEVIRQLGGK